MGCFGSRPWRLLAATVWMLHSDADRPWKEYQRIYRDTYAPKTAIGIRQIVLPELTQDLNFRRVARCDRCTTCHLGIDRSQIEESPAEISQPYQCHPRLDLFVGSASPHPDRRSSAARFATRGKAARPIFVGPRTLRTIRLPKNRGRRNTPGRGIEHWDFPMLPARFAESRCLAVPHFRDRPGADRPIPRSAGGETGGRLPFGAPFGLFRLPRN